MQTVKGNTIKMSSQCLEWANKQANKIVAVIKKIIENLKFSLMSLEYSVFLISCSQKGACRTENGLGKNVRVAKRMEEIL